MEPALHAANALLLLSYAARDILWLRLLTVLGLAILLAHEALDPAPDRVMALWNGAFLVLNTTHAAWLLWERRPMQLSDQEMALRYLVFDGLSDPQFRRLMAEAIWEEHLPGTGLLAAGQPVRHLRLLTEGRVVVAGRTGGCHALGPGAFLGEMGFLTEEFTSAAVICDEPSATVAWPVHRLRAQLDEDPNLRAVFHSCLGVDVALKLRAAS